MEKTNIRFLHLLQGKDVAEEIDIFYTPAYASGNVVVDGLLSNVLLSQTYYKSEIVLVIKALCGMPGLLYDKHAAQNLIRSKPKPRLFDNFKNLSLIDMPDDMVGKSFAIVFETFLLDKGALTLGIYRAPDEDMGNELSFVYTNPVPSLVMRKSDKVYVLAAQGWTY